MRKHKKVVFAVVLVLIAAGAAVYFFFLIPPPPEEKAALAPQEPSVSAKIQPEEEIEPIEVELNESDELVRNLVKELSSHPGFARWLLSDNLIRRFVSIVDTIAYGRSPRRLINSIELEGDFRVSEAEGKIFLDPKSYERYKRVADIFASLDTKGSVKLYKQMRLSIQQAYRELGYPEEDFNATLKKAIQELLKAPIVEDRIYLEKDVITYTIADPELEKLSPAQKHLVRMGPENMRTIQAKLREIAQALDFQI